MTYLMGEDASFLSDCTGDGLHLRPVHLLPTVSEPQRLHSGPSEHLMTRQGRGGWATRPHVTSCVPPCSLPVAESWGCYLCGTLSSTFVLSDLKSLRATLLLHPDRRSRSGRDRTSSKQPGGQRCQWGRSPTPRLHLSGGVSSSHRFRASTPPLGPFTEPHDQAGPRRMGNPPPM